MVYEETARFSMRTPLESFGVLIVGVCVKLRPALPNPAVPVPGDKKQGGCCSRGNTDAQTERCSMKIGPDLKTKRMSLVVEAAVRAAILPSVNGRPKVIRARRIIGLRRLLR